MSGYRVTVLAPVDEFCATSAEVVHQQIDRARERPRNFVMAVGQARAAALAGAIATITEAGTGSVSVAVRDGRWRLDPATLWPPPWLERAVELLDQHGGLSAPDERTNQ